MTKSLLTELYFGGIDEELQRKYAGFNVAYRTNRNNNWQLGVVPPIGDDDIKGDYIEDFPMFIILPDYE
jgi:hypothetical protein